MAIPLPNKVRSRARQIRRRLLTISALGMVAMFALACCRSPAYYGEKYAPAETPQLLHPATTITQPDPQLEDHTCGFHALVTIYRAFGLDPDVARLRFRLGVDEVAVPFGAGTRGTLHPDLLRVLTQDGFRADIVPPEEQGAASRLCAHLDNGHPALVLVRLPSGGLHWIVYATASGDSITVVDSLQPDAPREQPLSLDPRDGVLSVMLVRARQPDEPATGIAKAHAQGVAEMARTYRRVRSLSTEDP